MMYVKSGLALEQIEKDFEKSVRDFKHLMWQVPVYVARYVNYDKIDQCHESGTWNPNSPALTLKIVLFWIML